MITRTTYGYITIILAAAFSLLFTASCTNDESEYVTNDRNLMTFAKPVMKGISRAPYTPQYGDLVNPYPTTEQMVVFGKKYKGVYNGWSEQGVEDEFNGEAATFTESLGGWSTSVKHYWKKGYSYTFNAYSPAETALMGKIQNGDNGLIVTDFQPGNLGKQYDLMFTERIYDQTKDGMVSSDIQNGQYGGVPLTFKHALSSIHIKICVDPAFVQSEGIKDGQYKIQKIWISGVDEFATFKQNITPTPKYVGEDENGNNIYVMTFPETPAWTGNEDKKDRSYTFLKKNKFVKIPTTPGVDKEKALVDITDPSLGGHMALLIPQSLTGIKLHVTWTNDGLSTSPVGKTDVYELSTFSKSWEMGHKYIYKLTFSGNKIFFAPSVEDMTDGDVKEIEYKKIKHR